MNTTDIFGPVVLPQKAGWVHSKSTCADRTQHLTHMEDTK